MNASPRRLTGKPIKVEYRELGMPTAERLLKSGGAFEIGDDKQGTRVYRFQDSPLERAMARKAFHHSEFAGLMKFRHHWYHADLAPHVSSIDLDRVFAADFGAACGMPKTERQAHHRSQYRTACEKLSAHPDGHKIRIVVDNVVCSEQPLHIAGFAIGYNSPHRAREGAERRLCSAGDILARLWGI